MKAFRKINFMLRELKYLVREHRLWFLAPTLLLLCLFSILFFKLGPGIIVTFIYAGV